MCTIKKPKGNVVLIGKIPDKGDVGSNPIISAKLRKLTAIFNLIIDGK